MSKLKNNFSSDAFIDNDCDNVEVNIPINMPDSIAEPTPDNNKKPKKESKKAVSWVTTLKLYLANNIYDFKYNNFRDYLMINNNNSWERVKQNDITDILMRLREDLDCDKSGLNASEITNVIQHECLKHGKIVDIIQSIQQWDGQDHIGELFKTIKLEDESKREFFEEIMEKWLIGLVVCASNNDKEQADNAIMPIFFSKGEGLGKSKWFQTIVEKAFGNDYFSFASSGEYERDLAMCSKVMVLYDEIKITKKIEDVLKRQITGTVIDLRKKYDVMSEQRVRKASLCGTTNDPSVLAGLQANRRFTVFHIEDCDWKDNGINYKQVIAQAKHLWKQGVQYWMSRELIQENKEESIKYVETNKAMDCLRENLGSIQYTFKSVKELASHIHFDIKNKDDYSDLKSAVNFYARRTKDNRIVIGLKLADDVIAGLNEKLKNLQGREFVNKTDLFKKLNISVEEKKALDFCSDQMFFVMVRKHGNYISIKHRADIDENDIVQSFENNNTDFEDDI